MAFVHGLQRYFITFEAEFQALWLTILAPPTAQRARRFHTAEELEGAFDDALATY